ncbi:MAG: DoxX family protein [Gemmatimonadetes bacterium]|jgi:putative oxidoreductase|nr:DoxX family protein [Gemmatimonadota bacterium]
MLSILRVVAAAIFITSGTTKMLGFPPGPQGMPPFTPLSQTGIAGILEVVGGIALLLGVFTRPVAFVLAGMMAVAYFQFHFPTSFYPTVNGGIPAILFCFIFLYLVFAGAGPWSIDASLATRRRSRRRRGM